MAKTALAALIVVLKLASVHSEAVLESGEVFQEVVVAAFTPPGSFVTGPLEIRAAPPAETGAMTDPFAPQFGTSFALLVENGDVWSPETYETKTRKAQELGASCVLFPPVLNSACVHTLVARRRTAHANRNASSTTRKHSAAWSGSHLPVL